MMKPNMNRVGLQFHFFGRFVTLHSSVESGSTPNPNPRLRGSMSPPTLKAVNDGFFRLSDDLVEEVFFRLPPDEPAYLVRASAVRKNWRRILADAGFRRSYREFHATPPVLGLFQEYASFVPTTDLFPALRDYRPRWGCAPVVLDCRHGPPSPRALPGQGQARALVQCGGALRRARLRPQ